MVTKTSGKTLWVSTLFHLTVLVHHAWILAAFAGIDLDMYDHPIVMRIKPFRFLTISGWCFEFQVQHVVLSLIVEWQHWRGSQGDQGIISKYGRYRDMLFRALVLPFTLLVSGLFWSLFLIDRDLVYPKIWDSVVPNRVNHGIHTATVVFTLLELVMRRNGEGSRSVERRCYWAVSLGYALLLNTIYLTTGTWFYPFLGLLSWYKLLAFQLLFSCAGRGVLELAWRLDGLPAERDKVI